MCGRILLGKPVPAVPESVVSAGSVFLSESGLRMEGIYFHPDHVFPPERARRTGDHRELLASLRMEGLFCVFVHQHL